MKKEKRENVLDHHSLLVLAVVGVGGCGGFIYSVVVVVKYNYNKKGFSLSRPI